MINNVFFPAPCGKACKDRHNFQIIKIFSEYSLIFKMNLSSVQPVAAQCPLLGEMPGAEGFEEGVELRAVVGVAEMAELVEDDIVPQLVRKAHEVEI